jgi:hypothetical protein
VKARWGGKAATVVLAINLWGACGGSTGATGGGGAGQGSAGQGSASGASGGENPTGAGTAESDVRRLLAAAVVPRLCDELRGTFVGLPGEHGSAGPAAGADPTVGRWWIRECSATRDGDALQISIAGTGWTWVDRESMGFRVRQYLRFDARAAFRAVMDLGYDDATGIATIWMRPGPDVTASVQPRGLVRAEATNVLSGMLGGLLELTGSSVNERAQRQVAEEGSQRLRDRFSRGLTVTLAIASQQMDFMVGALARGEVPMRPYPPETGVVWLVNQRVQIWPGGMDVVGPLPEGRGAHALDLELEEGEGLRVDALCQADFERFYDQMLQGGTPTPPRGTRVMEFARVGAQRQVIPTLGCPTLLLLVPNDRATLPVRMRLRVTPADAPTETLRAQQASAGGPTVGGGGETTGAGSAPPVRIQLTSMVLSPVSVNGSRWDLIGGEPDPYVIVVSIPGQREVDRTAVISDRHEATLDHWLPGAFRPEDLPLRFSVYDDDVGTDELIGVGDLAAAQVTAGHEISVELRSTDTVPRTMGTLRLRVQLVR